MSRFLTLFCLCLCLAACHWHIDDISTDPSPFHLDFPAGIAMDPDGRYIYVSNGNADLSYGGGTIMMLDVDRFECAMDLFKAVQAGTAGKEAGYRPREVCKGYPSATDIQVTLGYDGIPVAGCVTDPLDAQVIDCVEIPFILNNATVRVGNFAGTMRIRRTGPAATRATSRTRTLYTAVRGDPSITYTDIDLDKRLMVNGVEDMNIPGLLDCFDADTDLLHRDGYDVSNNTTTLSPRCDPSHLIQTYDCPDRFGCVQGDNDIPSEPFNMLLEEGTSASGADYSRLLIAHLSAGQVTLVNLLGAPVVADVSPPFFAAQAGGRHGAFGIARWNGGATPLYYLTSDLSPVISTFYIAENEMGGQVVPGGAFPISGAFSSGADGREIIFAPDQQRAFMSQNAPPSVAVVDTRADQPNSEGLPADRVVDEVQVCQAPSHMVLRQSVEAGPAGADPAVRSRLFVSCFISNQIMLVDPDRPGVDETILVGRGPNEMVLNYSGLETPVADRLPTPLRQRAYVTHYSENTIGVIDLVPGSPTENRLIGRIGLPLPPVINP